MCETPETMEMSIKSGIISKIERQKRAAHRYNVYIDDTFALAVHEDVLIKHRLLKGETVLEDDLKRILEAEEKSRAYLDAVRLLSSRLRSEHEMRTRLVQKGYGIELAQETTERLRQEGYLNDQLFADQLAKQRLQSQKKGRNWIKQELKQKGLSKDHIAQAMEQVDEATEYQMALSLASKRYASELAKDPLKAKRKIGGFLMRRGYAGSIVSKVLSQLKSAGHGAEEETDWNEDEFE
ncbi:RecX family transcriptional regulator [Paenibacillus filicis]|uniref:Regulatory protein RecX n=1 Tax=Paenibacillus gyeongsangnamensis TaxID=3388067 RepID=A0ABT4Q648_9BACL|nr:RecX family transcriptional regulator [Paenibacillus filicis]MCZ8512293.1 RecX family transcriptional regulator [Paenibacillus filicis]